MKKILIITLMLLPTMVFAQEAYRVLVGIPGVETTSGKVDFNNYINALYALSISIAGLLAVIKIVIGGVKWMTSDIVTTKGEAKKDIQGALIGLLIVLAAVLIIYVINPKILEVNLDLERVGSSSPPPAQQTEAASEYDETKNVKRLPCAGFVCTPASKCEVGYEEVGRSKEALVCKPL